MKLTDKTKDILEWIACILIAFILAIAIRFFVGTPTIVKQPSMFPTLKPNQRLILNRWMRTTHSMPKRGDIVTFEEPSENFVYASEYNPDDVVARYSSEPTSAWGKFVYYVLEFGKDSYIKRVIALPGEHLQIYDGKVYVDGNQLEENYLQPEVTTTIDEEKQPFYDLVVPDNCIFVMGDNRSASTDSRSFGCIPLDKVESKVWIRFWPLNLFGKVN